MNSIFPILTVDRSQIHWEDHIYAPTPVESLNGMLWKREDKFAPLGFGSINGSKLRQLIWLFSQVQNLRGVVSGAVTGSPQHPMVALCAKHWGVPCVQLTGGKPGSKDHDMIIAAEKAGAQILHTNPGYAATLNAKAKEMAEERGWLHIETNITVDQEKHMPEAVEAFHKVGSFQVQNIPDIVDTLIIPAGSCNSVVSVLYGIARFRPKLSRIILMGIGSFGSKDPQYIQRRINTIGKAIGQNMDTVFRYSFNKSQPRTPYEIIHFNVNQGCGHCSRCQNGYCEYNDLMEFKEGELEFHPRYEAKTWHYMNDHLSLFAPFLTERTLYWIIGGKPII